MVLDLFTTHAGTSSRKSGGGGATSRVSTAAKAPTKSKKATALSATAPDSPDVQRLFHAVCEQLSKTLKTGATESPSTMFTLASYFTKVEPMVGGKPFCVALSNATFLYHMQMSRIAEVDVIAYYQLVGAAIAQIPIQEKPFHPFITMIVRDSIFGLPSPTCEGGAHCVVLVPPHQYRAFSELACHLVESQSVPEDIVFSWQDQLDEYVKAASPLVAYRAEALLARTANDVPPRDHVRELHQVLRAKQQKINLDLLLACFERFQKVVPDPVNGSTSSRMITIHCSELFLKFRSPIRRKYVERYLYPSLCSPDMQQFVQIPLTRKHLCQQLLRQCTPNMSPSNPFYLCLCALIQPFMDDETSGAIELIQLFQTQMPHASYVFGALAIDTHMSVSTFSKIVMILTRAAGTLMAGRSVSSNEVAEAIGESTTGVYNILYALREAARQCALAANRHAADVLKALRVAVQPQTINALGQFAKTAFDGLCDISVAPELLVAELGMIIHELNIREALDACVAHFHDATAICHFCSGAKNQSLVCPVNGTVHLSGHAAVSRVLATLSECTGTKAVEEGIVALLRDPATQMDTAVHFLLYHLLSNAGQHKPALFRSIEPYVRSTLMTLQTSYRERRPLVSSDVKNNVMLLHVKLAILVGQAVDPTYLQAVLKVFAELPLRNNHDALAQWYMCNLLIRQGRQLVELLPSDPLENNYCLAHPGCAPQSSIAADNAQMLLQLIDKSHNYSEVSLKLTGCCVCKLIQDFNVQAMNIVSSLLAPFGFINIGMSSLARIAFPVGAGSTFWTFILRQLKSSAPARTSILATLAKSISTRFRTENPSAAVSIKSSEATGPVFVVAMYEAMKRCAPLTRIVTHVMSLWLKQPQHTPGKFICLAYVCAELACVVSHRGSGPGTVELDAETLEDRDMFDESVKGTVDVLESQLGRMMTLANAVQDNTAFRNLVRRVHRRARGIVAEVTTGHDDTESGTHASQQSVDEEAARGGGEVMPSRILKGNSDRAASLGDSEFDAAEELSLNDLIASNKDDDGVFDDPQSFDQENDDDDGDDFDDDYQRDVNAEDQQHPQSRNAAHGAVMAGGMKPHVPAQGHVDVATPSSTITLAPSSTMYSAVADRVAVPQKPSDILTGRKRQPSGATDLNPRSVAQLSAMSSTMTSRAASPSIHLRSGDQSVARLNATAAPEDDGSSDFTLPRSRNMSAAVGSSRSTRRASRQDNSFTIEPHPKPLPNLQAHSRSQSSRRRVGDIATCCAPSNVVLDYLMTAQGKDSVLHELQQFNSRWLNMQSATLNGGDHGQHLHAHGMAAAAGSNRYHAPHEDYVAVPQVAMMPVTVEGRSNNYSVPHSDRAPHPTRVVVTAMNVFPTERSNPASGSVRSNSSKSVRAREEEHDGRADEEQFAPRLGGPGGSASREQSLALKRHRTEAAPSAIPRGMQFFLNQSADTALNELQGPVASSTPGRMTLPPRPTTTITPYGQRVLPVCLVEQQNDTAMRELRQVMGTANPNLTASATAKRYTGSGGEDVNRDSAGWYALTGAPMPEYAADPQYSLELF